MSRILTAEQAAALLSLPLSTVHQLCRSGQLPMVDGGIDEDALMDLFEPRRFAPFRAERPIDGPEVGGIYFLHSKSTRRIKIGSSRNIRARISEVHGASPEPLELLGYIQAPNPRECERAWHRMFSGSQVHNEWFRAGRSLRRFIRTHAKTWP